jgi:hypothetical protein
MSELGAAEWVGIGMILLIGYGIFAVGVHVLGEGLKQKGVRFVVASIITFLLWIFVMWFGALCSRLWFGA